MKKSSKTSSNILNADSLQPTNNELAKLRQHRIQLLDSEPKSSWYHAVPLKAAFAAVALAAASVTFWQLDGQQTAAQITTAEWQEDDVIENYEFYLWMSEQS